MIDALWNTVVVAVGCCMALVSNVATTAARVSDTLSLAYRPFLDPLPADDIWLVLMLPLVFAIALVYKTIKLDDSRQLIRQTTYLSMQIVVFMTLATTALWVLGAIV